MRDLARLIIAILILQGFMGVAYAQKRGRTGGAPRTPVTAPADPRLTFPAPRQFNHGTEIKTSYDRFKDEATVSMLLEFGEHSETMGMILIPSPTSIHVSFSYKGQKLIAPPRTVSFLITRNVWRQLIRSTPEPQNPTPLIILAGDDRLTYSALAVSKITSSPLGDDYWRKDDYFESLPLRDFLRIVNSSSVEMQAGNVELKLRNDQLEAFRDFASRMNPNAMPLPASTLGQQEPRPPTASPVVGTWTLTIQPPAPYAPQVWTLTIQQSGDSYNVTASSPDGTATFTTVNVSGNRFTAAASEIKDGQQVVIALVHRQSIFDD